MSALPSAHTKPLQLSQKCLVPIGSRWHLPVLASVAPEAVVMSQRGLVDNCIAHIPEDIFKLVSCISSNCRESLEKLWVNLHCNAISLDCILRV